MTGSRDGVRSLAFVTGAGRGPGKAWAVKLVAAFSDWVFSAKCVCEGEEVEDSSSLAKIVQSNFRVSQA